MATQVTHKIFSSQSRAAVRFNSGARAQMKQLARVYSYAYLLMAAHKSLKLARSATREPFVECMNIMLYSALASEAFLNHLGAQLIPHWVPLKRKLSTFEKLEFLAASKGSAIDWGARPYQSLATAIKFRNSIVHAETSLIEAEALSPSALGTTNHWHSYCNLATAERILEDIEAMIKLLPESFDTSAPPAFLLAESVISS